MIDWELNFIKLRLEVECAMVNHDHRKNNQAMKKLQKIFKFLEKNPYAEESQLVCLLEHENDCVRLGAASFCLALKLQVKNAQQTLIGLSKFSSNPIIRFNAESTLSVWKEQGYLKIYPDQQV